MVKLGEIIIDSEKPAIKQLFGRQWINGDLNSFMASVKRRTKEAYGIDLVFATQDEFIAELIRYELIRVVG